MQDEDWKALKDNKDFVELIDRYKAYKNRFRIISRINKEENLCRI